jgi:hypothetical protein
MKSEDPEEKRENSLSEFLGNLNLKIVDQFV